MSYPRARAVFAFAGLAALALPVGAQSVISTRSGVIHFFEGGVFLNDQPLEARLGRYPTLSQGAGLRTAEGRAEVLLTPGVFLRLGQHSAIKMVSNSLADTQVELETGAVILDSGEPNPGTSVALIYKDWTIHLLEKGVYRVDSDPPRLWVREGEAEVWANSGGEPLPVEQGMSLPLAAVLVPESSIMQPLDALSNWADGRGQSIAADNAISAQIDEDPDAAAGSLDTFSYFPLVGAPSVDPGMSSAYSYLYPTQPGFNSIYLPGYTYRPYFLGLLGSPARPYSIYPSRRITVSPGIGSYVSPTRSPYPVRSAYPTYTSRPSYPVRTTIPSSSAPIGRPGVVHSVPRGAAVHVGAHR
jgi:hypothetical protein